MTDRNLVVSTVVSGLTTPTGIAFLDRNDFFVLEQLTGKVKRIVNGAVQSTVLDLGVKNFPADARLRARSRFAPTRYLNGVQSRMHVDFSLILNVAPSSRLDSALARVPRQLECST